MTVSEIGNSQLRVQGGRIAARWCSESRGEGPQAKCSGAYARGNRAGWRRRAGNHV